MNSTDPKIGKTPMRQAVEDAIVVGGIAGVAALTATAARVGGMPDVFALYTAGLAALMGGLLAWARARQIQKVP